MYKKLKTETVIKNNNCAQTAASELQPKTYF